VLTGTRRTVFMLAGCQALSMTGGSIVGLTGAIVGSMLTPDKALSTLPIAVQQAGVMAATIPAALLMARIGRRPGFWLGAAIGGVGAVITTWAIFRSSFEWFCFGAFLLGANRGATQQYRFAAAEIAEEMMAAAAAATPLKRAVEADDVAKAVATLSARENSSSAVTSAPPFLV
jgi:MFS family permease